MVVGVFYTNNVQVFIMVGALYLFSLGGITFPNYLLGETTIRSTESRCCWDEWDHD